MEAVNYPQSEALPIEDPYGDYKEYVDRNRFNRNIIVDEVLKRHTLITFVDTGRTWIYDKSVGHYLPNAEAAIRTYITLSLSIEAKKSWIEEALYLIKQRTNSMRKNHEPPPNLINLENGVFDIETRTLTDHTPDHFFTSQLPVKYDPTAECPKFLDFIKDIVKDDDAQTLQEYTGYLLYRSYIYQKALLLVGEGNNGKSTFLMAQKALIGNDNITSISLQHLDRRFTPARLYHKLANIYPDLSARALKDTGMFKITTGGDTIEAEVKYSMNTLKFVNHAKHEFSANTIPKVDEDDTDAFFRRWIIINFPNTFTDEKCDKDILQKITTPQELSGILNWALEGLTRLHDNADFTYDKTPEEIRDHYQRLSSSIYGFLTDQTTYDPEGWIPKENLYSLYITYCIDENLPRKSKAELSKEIPKHMPAVISQRQRVDKQYIHGWHGIRQLNPDEKEEPEAGQMKLAP